MNKLVPVALAALFFVGSASAQNLPPIDIFGGYSYLSFDLPSNVGTGTSSQRLALNGYDFSATFGMFHHVSAEADFSGHSVSDCESTTLNCSDFSYMFGPRFNFRDRSKKITAFVHVLAGRDNATLVLPNNGQTLSDTSVALAAGAGVDYWVVRHIGVQLGPFDYFYTRHFNDFGLPSQNSYRASAGVVFRFGGPLFAGEPKPRPVPAEKQPSSSSRRGAPPAQPSTGVAAQPAAQVVSIPGRGMSIGSLGVIVAPRNLTERKLSRSCREVSRRWHP